MDYKEDDDPFAETSPEFEEETPEVSFETEKPEVQPEAEPAPEESFSFSRRAVTNCLLNKLKARAPKTEPRVKASDLEKRLALLKY